LIEIYTDGSFSSAENKAGWGWVAVFEDLEIAAGYGSVYDEDGSRNIAGELAAVCYALVWVIENDIEEIKLYHDYIGVQHWATGHWKTKSSISKQYAELVRPAMELVDITFIKVKGHSGNKWNDYADKLAHAYMEEGE